MTHFFRSGLSKALFTVSLLLACGIGLPQATASTTATNSGIWTDPSIWNNGVPAAGDDVYIRSPRNVTITNPTPYFNFLMVSNGATLTFCGTAGYGTNVILSATNMWIYGTVTHSNITTTNAVGGIWAPSNSVYIMCSNLTVATGGWVNVNLAGYPAAPSKATGRGPGATLGSGGGSATGGAGHGGRGGQGLSVSVLGGVTNDSITAPVDAGSSSGADLGTGSAGGGIIRVDATGTVTVNGRVTANGQDGSNRGGGGAGGSIYITCQTMQGFGLITAAGGALDSVYSSGGGGGGRIAVIYNPEAQSNAVASAITFGAAQGAGVNGVPGRPGTVYFPDTTLLSTNLMGGQFIIPSFASWYPDTLTITNGLLALPAEFDLRVTNNLVLSGVGGGLEITNSTLLAVGGNLILTNYGSLYVYSPMTNGASPEYGTLVDVTGTVVVATNSAIYPYSHPTNGGSVLFRMSNLTVNVGGRINADAKGFAGGSTTSSNGFGPGGGEKNYGGAGYGGPGWGARSGYGGVYGSLTQPTDPGSGGGGVGGAGGGLVRMEIADMATINGIISAIGGAGTYGGSGGGIFLKVRRFGVAFGKIQADGGTGSSRGGGGGRMAMSYWAADGFDGVLTVAAGGSGANTGSVGTIYRSVAAGYLTLVVRGYPARHDVAVPYDYGSHGFLEGALVTNTIPLISEQNSTSRYYCTGWSVTNSAGTWLDGNTSTQAIFTISTNLFLTWFWTNQYYLSTTTNGNGSLAMDRTGGYTNGTVLSLTAVPGSGSAFVRWSGAGLPLGNATDNPLTVTMTRSRSLQANFSETSAVSRVWTGTGNWLSMANWAPVGLPSSGDTITIKSGTCTLTDPMTVAGLVISNGATLSFNGTGYYGTNLLLTVNGDVSIKGTITHAANSATAPDLSGLWIPDNGVYLRAVNVNIATNGKINGDSLGFAGGVNYLAGNGPGRTLSSVNGSTGGAGYGGRGGAGSSTAGGATYGDSNAPAFPGSGSGADHGGGRAGGGYVRLEAANRLTVDGTITVNGLVAQNRGGGGSGGGVFLKCLTFAGIGSITANGGSGELVNYLSGPGGGGRIAVWGVYRRDNPVMMTALAGVQNIGTGPAEAGTVVWRQLPIPGTIILVR
jgi:hypothetical protein